MLDDIKEIWESVIRCVIRFFDNRFHKSDEIDFLRMEISKLHSENIKLYNQLIGPTNELISDVNTEDLKPIGKTYVPWNVRKHQLEKNSLDKLEEVVLNKHHESKS